MKHYFYLIFGIATFLLFGCSDQNSDIKKSVVGLVPVYGNAEDISSYIKSEAPHQLRIVGKIYTYGDLLFINEIGEGVHVFDNSDPKAPSALKFITIPGNVDVAIKNGYMYADLGSGLATLDIENLDEIKLTHFDDNYVSQNIQNSPPRTMLDLIESNKIYFECPNQNKGKIIAWKLETIENPECFINN